jgi:sortase A
MSRVTTSIRKKGTDTRAGRGKRRWRLTILGVMLLLGGLSCLGWVGYQYVGTNLIAQHAFRTEASRLRAQWMEGRKADPQGLKEPSTRPGDAIGLLRIPALGDAYEVPILNGTELGVLAKGVGHYSSTAQPGQTGNFALAGYRVTHGQPFARLLGLDSGDQIIVETRYATYTYLLDEPPRQLTVKDTDTWVIDPVPGKPQLKPTQALITLTTCPDLFHSTKRSIGFGHLIQTERKL